MKDVQIMNENIRSDVTRAINQRHFWTKHDSVLKSKHSCARVMRETALKWLEVEVRRVYTNLQIEFQSGSESEEYLALYGIHGDTQMADLLSSGGKGDWLTQAEELLKKDDQAVALGYGSIPSRASLVESLMTALRATQEFAAAEQAYATVLQEQTSPLLL